MMAPRPLPTDPSALLLDSNDIPIDPNAVLLDPNAIPVDPNAVGATLSPAQATVLLGQWQGFTLSPTNIMPGGGTWYVNGIPGGNSVYGTNRYGNYHAPTQMPSNPQLTLLVVSLTDPTVWAQAMINLVQPPPVGVTISPTNVSLLAGQIQGFDTTTTNDNNAGLIFSVNGIPGGNLTIGTNRYGNYTAPAIVTTNTQVIFAATSQLDSSVSAQAVINLLPRPPVGVTISPTNVTLLAGQIQGFNTTTTNDNNAGLIFSVNGIPGGNLTIGTNRYGNYTAPATVATNTQVIFTATSQLDPSVSAQAVINLLPRPPVGVTISPTNVTLLAGQIQGFNTTTTNDNNAGLIYSVNGIPGGNLTIGTNRYGNYTAPATVATKTQVIFTATSQLDPSVSAQAVITLLPRPPVGVTISPTNVTLLAGQVQGFNTTTTNDNNAGLIYSVNGIPGGNLTIGTNRYGNYTAPATVATKTQVIFTATSQLDPSVSAQAVITLLPRPPVGVTISPTNVTLLAGQIQGFDTTTTNDNNSGLIFSVNGIPGGNLTIGTNRYGNYVAPQTPTNNLQVTFSATSQLDPTVSANATITIVPFPTILSVTPSPIPSGNTTFFISGYGFTPGVTVYAGSTALQTRFLSPNQLKVSGYLAPTMTRFLGLTATNISPLVSSSDTFIAPTEPAVTNLSFPAACRILEQATWGPTAISVDNLQQKGFEAWWSEQTNALPTTFFVSTNISLQRQFLDSAMTNVDQLRQRVAFALSGIIVVSGNKNTTSDKFVPYLNTLSQDALGPFLNLLTDITLCPSMGYYLDLVNNFKANPALNTLPNENYARELMQLFSVGPQLLNPDGTLLLDSAGRTYPTYGQTEILETARALTGWIYGGVPDAFGHTTENFTLPMMAMESTHDTGGKTLIGGLYLPPGQTARADLDATLQALVRHPNTAPFISSRLIQHLVTSNPSTNYVRRIGSVFTQTSGNLGAVVHAILTDPEARAGDDPRFVYPTNFGHLREPILFSLSVLRAIGAQGSPAWLVYPRAQLMGQSLLAPPSVFGYYSPNYLIDTGIRGPEFQLLSKPSTIYRVNFVNTALNAMVFDRKQFSSLASDATKLLAGVNNTFFYGRMPPEVQAAVLTAITNSPDIPSQFLNALYLSATSNAYQVQH